MPNNRPRNPWKVLLWIAVLLTVGFWLILAGGFWWMFSGRGQARQEAQTPWRAERREPAFRWNRRQGEAPPGADPRQDRQRSAAAPVLSETRSNSIAEILQRPVKNAIGALSRTAGETFPADDLFKEAFIPKLELEIPAEGMTSLRRSPRNYVRCVIREGDRVYRNVAIRLKGGPGSFRPLGNTPAFTVNFDKFGERQTFHGLKKIHLNNSVQDPSYLSEKISRELFDAAGVPAPRAGNALVLLNGQVQGLYVLVEGINKQFLHRYFKDATGNVYDGHSGSDVTDSLPTNSGDQPADKSALRALASAAREPVGTRLAALEKTLDVDRFLSFMAMETILWHWDGYSMSRNNFRIFHDRESGRMVFIPQGLDQILTRPTGPIFAQTGGIIARSLMEIPEARKRYRARIAELSTNIFRADAVLDRIHEVADKIEAVQEQTYSQWPGIHRQHVNQLCRRVQQRAASLRQQIVPAVALAVSKSDALSAADWEPKTDLGEARLTREHDAEGRTLLHISTSSGCTASWRARVLLGRNNYRFDARLKTQGVVLAPDDPRAGAGLRISRFRKGQKNSGDRDWTPVNFEFQVQEDEAEIELVCELRADRGEVWFDLGSFKLGTR